MRYDTITKVRPSALAGTLALLCDGDTMRISPIARATCTVGEAMLMGALAAVDDLPEPVEPPFDVERHETTCHGYDPDTETGEAIYAACTCGWESPRFLDLEDADQAADEHEQNPDAWAPCRGCDEYVDANASTWCECGLRVL